MSTVYEESLNLHEKHRGKLEVISKVKVTNKEELSLAYSPGVAEPCRKIAKDKEDVYKYTNKGNLVAVITDGSAVLGLGNIGPEAALPVMEGKSILLKEFAGVDSIPICLATQDTEEIIRTCKLLAPGLGAINLEDISAPRCIQIETALKEQLDIPVFHDDQHGTAIVVTAALINAYKLLKKDLGKANVVVCGSGAAGSSIVRMLDELGVNDIIAVDSKGILSRDDQAREYDFLSREIAAMTNSQNIQGGLSEAVRSADIFIGVSVPAILTQEMVKTMNADPLVFAMANPTPEIMPDQALAAGARIVGTGRSDFPNQINNVLAFPGLFRGALDAQAQKITEEMKMASAKAIAEVLDESELREDYIIPDPFDNRVVKVVAEAVARVAKELGICRS